MAKTQFLCYKVKLKITPVNRALPALHGESLEITLTIPLYVWYFIKVLFRFYLEDLWNLNKSIFLWSFLPGRILVEFKILIELINPFFLRTWWCALFNLNSFLILKIFFIHPCLIFNQFLIFSPFKGNVGVISCDP